MVSVTKYHTGERSKSHFLQIFENISYFGMFWKDKFQVNNLGIKYFFLFIFCLFYIGFDFCKYVTIALEVVDLGLAPHWGPGLRANL